MRKIICILACATLWSCSASRHAATSPSKPGAATVPAKGAPAGQPVMTQTFTLAQTQTITYPGMAPLPKGGLTVTPASWGELYYPCEGKMISDYGTRSGRMHSGVDIKAQPLDTIRAVADGVVRMSREYYGYGNMVLVSHPDGLETLYGHNTRNLVVPNQKVRAGQAIALAGRTGRATTEHCHFEVRAAGQYFDPNLLLDCTARGFRRDTLYIRMSGSKLVASAVGAGASGGGVAGAESVLRDASLQPSPVRSPQPAGKVGGGDAAVHMVSKGDTLYSISRRYGVTVDRLCQLNDIAQNAPLGIGQKILLK